LSRSEAVWWAAVRGVRVPSDGFDRQTDRQVDRQLSRQKCHPKPFGHFAKRGPRLAQLTAPPGWMTEKT